MEKVQPVQEKETPIAPADETVIVEVVQVPTVNDSSEGLSRMYNDLAPLAARVRGSATMLLFFSCLFMGTLEGLFGLIAATGVLCCAAPGSLGVAYAARCTRITATIAAVLAFMHVMCLTTFAVAVLPEMPYALDRACASEAKMDAKMVIPADAAIPMGAPVGASMGAIPAGAPVGTSMDSVAIVPETNGIVDFISAKIAEHTQAGTTDKAAISASLVATVATSAARRLQDVTHDDACKRTKQLFTDAVPAFIYAAIFVEMGLFFSALNTAKAAARLIKAARAYGANAM
jgi:hypothetical protein